ncbi:HtaA domain-containing protein [Streptomyces sp. NPDC093252]|uniref:HtaA domain-containing protein n=1 Tax=Streptomyces sp. NPDC093252 TaxID=3154980 RepID=UPI0034339F52
MPQPSRSRRYGWSSRYGGWSPRSDGRSPRYGWIAALCLAVAVLGALLPAGAASAASSPVQGGRLDWGVKSSFQTYVTGPIAQGSYTLTGGAATVGANQFRFHSASGSYDGDTGAFSAGFSGGVRFVGHRTDSGAHELDMTISRPTLRISGGSGTLYVDVTSKAKGTGTVTTSGQVPFASVSLGGIDMRGGGTAVTLNNLPATLTAEGAKSFAGYYAAGTPLDPVSLSADIAPAAAKPTPTPGASESARAEQDPAESDGDRGATEKLVDGAVDWGVRRTFREYVTGDIAQGEWTLSSGAQDGGALFRFPGGEGTYNDGRLKAEFTGEVRFTGEHGLDLRLSGVRVTVAADGEGTLHARVNGAAEDVSLVTFTAKDLKPKDGLVTVTEAPAKLTASGAEAFDGMYRKGTGMDPVSLAVALTEDATLPALPDLGSSAAPGAEPSPSQDRTAPAAEPVAAAGRDDGGFPALPVTLTATALLLAAAAYAAVHHRRRTRAAATPTDPTP